MVQTTLWHDTILDAIGSAVQAAGGVKRVATKLWPTLDPATAQSRLRAALNTDHPQKLDPSEVLAIAKLAKEGGENCVVEFIARELGYEFIEPLEPEETRARAIRARRLALLDELRQLDEDSE